LCGKTDHKWALGPLPGSQEEEKKKTNLGKGNKASGGKVAFSGKRPPPLAKIHGAKNHH